MAFAPSRGSSVADQIPVRLSRSRAPRPLAVVLFIGANVFVVIACAYLLLGRGDLPAFLPHAQRASHDPDANDFGMAAITLGIALGFLYASNYARTHRSWLRSRSWNRKHGRV
jgi:hypothetical protein